MPGVYDMMGASLHGVPHILIGFNQDVAWSHTVSTAQRFTLFEHELVDGNPYQYRYDDEYVEDVFLGTATQDVRDLAAGFAAGLNRYL